MKVNIRKVAISSLLISGVALIGASCSSDDENHDENKSHKSSETSHSHSKPHASAASHSGSHAAHWSYSGEGAPHAWGQLKEEYATCSTGKSQSPIDISPVTVANIDDIKFDYKSSKVKLSNNGHTIKVSYDAGSSITVNDKKYNLLQFHFHSPSEHTVGGKHYDMVAHLVHQATDGQLGVIGVMMKIGKENYFLRQLWKNLPEASGEEFESNSVKIRVENLLPKSGTYFNYSGSLTTPPCSEGVNWMVLAQPVNVSEAQVKAFTDMFPLSVRPVQPLNGRVVKVKN